MSVGAPAKTGDTPAPTTSRDLIASATQPLDVPRRNRVYVNRNLRLDKIEMVYRAHHESRRPRDFVFCEPERRVLFRDWVGTGGRVLDVGCRFGALTRSYLGGNEVVGIDVDRLFTWTFAFGSGLAAVGGGIAADIVGLSPTFAIQYLVFFLIVVTVGGAGSLWGAFIAALILGFLDNAGKYLWPEGGAFFIYIATLALLLRKPNGLFGRTERV